jgi:hypothetical protein
MPIVLVKTDQILLFNRDVLAATKVDGFGVTEDGRTLVQVNFGDQLHLYDVATGNTCNLAFGIRRRQS